MIRVVVLRQTWQHYSEFCLLSVCGGEPGPGEDSEHGHLPDGVGRQLRAGHDQPLRHPHSVSVRSAHTLRHLSTLYIINCQ